MAKGTLNQIIEAQQGGRDPGDALLTADEVAELLRVTRGWVYAETRARRIPHVRLGRYMRYRRSAVEAWVNDLEAASTGRVSRPGARSVPSGQRGIVFVMARQGRRTVGISGHVELIKRKRGSQFYVKYRLADGRQRMRRLGPAWSGGGRPPAGYFTRKTATQALLTLERIDGYRVRLVAEGRLSDRTINKLLVLLHGTFKRAQRVYGLVGNPVAAVERQPVQRSGDFEVLSPGEVAALARAAESEQDAALYVVAAFTGLRMGELLALRWGEVAFSKRLVHVRRSYTHGAVGPTKSGRVRSVPMIDDVVRVLDGLSRREHFTAQDDLVFYVHHVPADDAAERLSRAVRGSEDFAAAPADDAAAA